MTASMEFWLTFFITIAAGAITFGVLKAKVDQTKEDLASYKVEVDAKFKEKKDTMDKNHSVMWEKIDTFNAALNNISNLIVRVETKLDIYSKKE